MNGAVPLLPLYDLMVCTGSTTYVKWLDDVHREHNICQMAWWCAQGAQHMSNDFMVCTGSTTYVKWLDGVHKEHNICQMTSWCAQGAQHMSNDFMVCTGSTTDVKCNKEHWILYSMYGKTLASVPHLTLIKTLVDTPVIAVFVYVIYLFFIYLFIYLSIPPHMTLDISFTGYITYLHIKHY
jgi:hypothetical protein